MNKFKFLNDFKIKNEFDRVWDEFSTIEGFRALTYREAFEKANNREPIGREWINRIDVKDLGFILTLGPKRGQVTKNIPFIQNSHLLSNLDLILEKPALFFYSSFVNKLHQTESDSLLQVHCYLPSYGDFSYTMTLRGYKR